MGGSKESNYLTIFLLGTSNPLQMHSMAEPSGKPEGIDSQVLQFIEDSFLGQRLAKIIFHEGQLKSRLHTWILSSVTSFKNVISSSDCVIII
jgi:hypothetical protein